MRDPDDVEDIADGQDDHGFDGVTYGVQEKPLTATRKRVI
jgi:hypothetical protein